MTDNQSSFKEKTGTLGTGIINFAALYVLFLATNILEIILSRILFYSSPLPLSVAPFYFFEARFWVDVFVEVAIFRILVALVKYWRPHFNLSFVTKPKPRPDRASVPSNKRLDELFNQPLERRAPYVRAILADELFERIEISRRRATIILFVIGIALVSTVLIVVFAGRLTSLDAAAVSYTDRLSNDLDQRQTRLNQLGHIRSLLQVRQDAAGTQAADDAKKELDTMRFNSLGTTAESLPLDIKVVSAAMDALQKRYEETDQLLQAAWQKELNSERGYNDWRNIAATAIIRVGVVLIIVFLVQILMGLYRYNTRLVTYYASRHDIVDLWNGNLSDLPKLAAVFAPPRVDFGKEPRHPLEDIIRTVGENMQTFYKRKSGKTKNERPEDQKED